jgi:hypothetical protein
MFTFCVSTEENTAEIYTGNPEERRIYNESSKYVLIVGISDFNHDWISDLRYTKNDAENLYQTLTVYNSYNAKEMF